MTEPIHVTKTFLPPLEEYIEKLRKIWSSHNLTNNGPMVQELESKLQEYLGVKHVILVSNGDAGLRLCLKSMELTDEVITTPFTYVSTVSSIIWSGLKPVFADIEPNTLTIDPEQIEKAITPRTSAILATHVYGNPCDVHRLKEIADKHDLKLIYDAAHAFGVKYNGQRITNYGDVSMISLHATKLFHTGEGGLLATNNSKLAEQLEWRRRFGHDGPEKYHGVGINAKMSELHAALGLCNLKHINNIISQRKATFNQYIDQLDDSILPIKHLSLRPKCDWNYSYCPLILQSKKVAEDVEKALNTEKIFPRRYFYPSLNELPFLNYKKMPASEKIAERILCLPLSANLTSTDVRSISSLIKKAL